VSATPATRALEAAGVSFRLHAYRSRVAARGGDGYGVEAAGELGVEPARVLKTLVTVVDGVAAPAVVAVVAVDGRVDLRALAVAAGGKRAAVAEPALAQRVTGYVTGGISPLGQRRALPTVVDAAALDWPTVFCSAGRRGLELEVDPAELVRLLGATVAAIQS
jgi:Cys-tRNA(Pro)/Cys-tRNA(Cys) deacylase